MSGWQGGIRFSRAGPVNRGFPSDSYQCEYYSYAHLPNTYREADKAPLPYVSPSVYYKPQKSMKPRCSIPSGTILPSVVHVPQETQPCTRGLNLGGDDNGYSNATLGNSYTKRSRELGVAQRGSTLPPSLVTRSPYGFGSTWPPPQPFQY